MINYPFEANSNIFEIIVEKLLSKDTILKKQIKNTLEDTVFYLGLGKTGSMTIVNGLDYNTFHLHCSDDVDEYYDNILSKNNVNIYDLIKYIGQKYNYKPLIIECCREPISHMISLASEFAKSDFSAEHPYCHILPKHLITHFLETGDVKDFVEIVYIIINYMTTTINEEHTVKFYNYEHFKKNENFDIYEQFNPTDKYLFKEFNDYKLLILKFEDISNFTNTFNKHNYKYIENHSNESLIFNYNDQIKTCLTKIKEDYTLFKFTLPFLKTVYNKYSNLYTTEEIDNFIIKYTINK